MDDVLTPVLIGLASSVGGIVLLMLWRWWARVCARNKVQRRARAALEREGELEGWAKVLPREVAKVVAGLAEVPGSFKDGVYHTSHFERLPWGARLSFLLRGTVTVRTTIHTEHDVGECLAECTVTFPDLLPSREQPGAVLSSTGEELPSEQGGDDAEA